MDYTERTFENETITLDNNTFRNCTFRNCTIEYGGGKTAFDGDLTFDGQNAVVFTGMAKNVYSIVSLLLQGVGLNGAQLIGQAPQTGQSVQ